MKSVRVLHRSKSPFLNQARITSFAEENAALILWFLFGCSILSKIFIVPFLGAVTGPNGDEHVYIELAKAFYYKKTFLINGFPNIGQYTEILFPLLISPAYTFFSPENILTILRSACFFLMSLAVFPAYHLGLSVLGKKQAALLIALFAVLIPEITLAFSVVQEVIYYPLYLTALFLIYRQLSGKKVNIVLLGFMFFLLWACKAVGITVFLSYIVFLTFDFVFLKKFKNLKSFLFQLIVLSVIVFGLKELLSLGVRYLNSGTFNTVRDVYTNGLMNQLSLLDKTFLSDFLNGTFHYLFYLSVAFMILPVIFPLAYFKQYAAEDRKYLIFIGMCSVVTIVTIVFMIYRGEGGAAVDVQRVHYRYFFPLIIPLLVMLFKIDFSRIKLGILPCLFTAFLFLYTVFFQPEFRTGSIFDAKSLMFIEKINSDVIHGSNILALIVSLFLVVLFYLILSKQPGDTIRNTILITLLGVTFINQTYAVYKTYTYYTVGTTGIERRNDYIRMSREVETTPGYPVIMYPANTVWFEVLFSTQTNRDFTRALLQEGQLDYPYNEKYPPNFVITSKDLLRFSQLHGATKLPMNMRMFDMYQLKDAANGTIFFDYSLLNFYPDGWLKDNAKLFVSGRGRENQARLTLRLTTSPLAKNMEAVITDSTGKVTTARVEPNGTTLSLTVYKNANEKNFTLDLSSNSSFIPKDLPASKGGSEDPRKLTYIVDQIRIDE